MEMIILDDKKLLPRLRYCKRGLIMGGTVPVKKLDWSAMEMSLLVSEKRLEGMVPVSRLSRRSMAWRVESSASSEGMVPDRLAWAVFFF